MYKTFFTGSDFNESTESHKSCNNTVINSTDFGVICNCVDDIKSTVSIVDVNCSNEDCTVFFNVNLTVAFSTDFLNNFTLFTDNVTDFFNVNLSCEELGGISGKLSSGLGNNGKHNFIKDVHTSFVCFLESFFDDFGSKTVYLKVHLNSSDTFLSTCNLEVHIAEEVLKTLNVNHCHETVAFGNKTAGDTCNGSFNGNTCCHKCES